MYRSLALTIGLRYNRAKRNNRFISFISLTSMIGLILGVAVLILVLSVMNGFDRELRQRILGMVPHVMLQGYEPLLEWQQPARKLSRQNGIEAVAPYIHLQGMLTHTSHVQPVVLYGVDPVAEADVSILPQHMQYGMLNDLQAGEFGIVLGELVAHKLRATVGNKITLVLPEASLTIAGIMPRLKRFKVVGIFQVGAELDANLAIIHIADASKIKRLNGAVEGLRLKLTDLFNAPTVAAQAIAVLPDKYFTNDWTRSHGNLFQAIQLERRMLALLLLLIVAVAAFNIVSTLVMLVVDKQGDIAVLRALGATPATIMGIFIVQGCVIGLMGILVGSVVGIVLSLNITEWVAWLEQLFGFQVLSAEVYFISYFPAELRWENVLWIALISFSFCCLATLYPAWKASRVNPTEVLRYE